MLSKLLFNIYTPENNTTMVSFCAWALDMPIALYMAMAMNMAQASSHLEIV